MLEYVGLFFYAAEFMAPLIIFSFISIVYNLLRIITDDINQENPFCQENFDGNTAEVKTAPMGNGVHAVGTAVQRILLII